MGLPHLLVPHRTRQRVVEHLPHHRTGHPDRSPHSGSLDPRHSAATAGSGRGASATTRAGEPGPEQPRIEGKGRQRAAGLNPARILDLGFALYAGARLPGVRVSDKGTAGGARVWVSHESGAAATTATGEAVWQYGPGLKWEEIETAWREYEQPGSPDPGQFGLTVTDRGRQMWLREPHAVIEARHG